MKYFFEFFFQQKICFSKKKCRKIYEKFTEKFIVWKFVKKGVENLDFFFPLKS